MGGVKMFYRPTVFFQFMIAASMIFPSAAAFSADGYGGGQSAWLDRPYHYVAVDQTVREALSDLSRNFNVPIVIGESVKTRIRDQAFTDTAEDFLKQLSGAAQLSWYFDGSILHVDNQSELRPEIIDISNVGIGAVKDMLLHLGVMGQGVSAKLDGNVLRISGTPAFVAFVRQNLSAMTAPERQSEVRVFKGGTLEVVKDLPLVKEGSQYSAKSRGSIIVISSALN